MKTIFFGSTEFSSDILSSLHKEGVEFPFVVTKTKKKKGRGKREHPTPVGKTARELSLKLIETDNPNTEEMIEMINKAGMNSFLLASYGAILKPNILSTVSYPMNIHPSLLPKYRGVAPVRRTLMNGDKETGITIFLMDEHLDTGDIIVKKRVPIYPDELYTELMKRLSDVAADLALNILKQLHSGQKLQTIIQNEKEATYATRIKKDELCINWNDSASRIVAKIRSLSLKPGAHTTFRKKRLIILKATSIQQKPTGSSSGEIVKLGETIVVSCDSGSVEIHKLLISGHKPMNAKDFINGYHLKTGDNLKE